MEGLRELEVLEKGEEKNHLSWVPTKSKNASLRKGGQDEIRVGSRVYSVGQERRRTECDAVGPDRVKPEKKNKQNPQRYHLEAFRN